MRKKGLSDVVATVLIIFLVVAAVVAIWAFIQPSLKNAGSGIQKGQVCLTSTVEPITCQGDGSSYKIGYRRTTGEDVAGIESLQVSLKFEDGSVVSEEGEIPSSSGGTGNAEIITSNSAESVFISSEFNLQDGGSHVCNSIELTCDTTALEPVELRIEAEAAGLTYTSPIIRTSGGDCVCGLPISGGGCSKVNTALAGAEASIDFGSFPERSGNYEVDVRYCDERDDFQPGPDSYRVLVDGEEVESWTGVQAGVDEWANNKFVTEIKKGENIKVFAKKGSVNSFARIDYIEFKSV